MKGEFNKGAKSGAPGQGLQPRERLRVFPLSNPAYESSSLSRGFDSHDVCRFSDFVFNLSDIGRSYKNDNWLIRPLLYLTLSRRETKGI
jgi:hypothetical protein